MATEHDSCKPEALAKKLGLLPAKERPLAVTLLGAPESFRAQLGDLPDKVSFSPRLTPATTLAICFVRTLAEVNALFDLLATQLPEKASVWIARPKQHHNPGFNENHVRNAGLALGLVDYKICSFDNDWSGIKFTWRRATGGPAKT